LYGALLAQVRGCLFHLLPRQLCVLGQNGFLNLHTNND
jgi:hypothetical protein